MKVYGIGGVEIVVGSTVVIEDDYSGGGRGTVTGVTGEDVTVEYDSGPVETFSTKIYGGVIRVVGV